MAFAMGVAKYVPPPNIREEIVEAFAHCPDPRCKGVQQEPVKAVRETTEWTFASRGGGDDPGGLGNVFLPMVENSQSRLRFLMDGTDEHGTPDPTFQNDMPCPHCGKPRELSDAPRPNYPIQVGGANALLRLQELGVRFDAERQEQIQKGAPETPLELLQRRYVGEEITEEEFTRKRDVLAGGGLAAAAVVDEVSAAQTTRIQEMQEQIDRLIALAGQNTPEPDAEPRRGPGRPRKNPEV
jgi:hypothetical protein